MAGRHRKQHAVRSHGHRGRHRKPPSRQRAIVPTVTAVAVLAVGGVAFGHAIAQGQAPHSAGVVTPPTPRVVPPVIAAAPATPAPATSPKPKRAHHRHRPAPPALVVRDVGADCYIQITRHGHLLVRRILHPGQRLTFRHHGLDVRLGNAGAVRISVDGHHARRAGRPGQVRSLRVH